MISIKKETVKRLLKDIKDITLSPLHDDGIYYIHDEEDILKGYAMIIGPEETPYFGGYYFFEFNYPENYPYSPPKLSFKTNINKIRFNPNLYYSGKVCVSILNTWSGDQWSSCQSLRSVLLSLVTLLSKDPLLNEPGYDKRNPDFHIYTEVIEYSNINHACCDIILKSPKIYLPFFNCFEKHFNENFIKNYSKLLDFVRNKIKSGDFKKKIFIHCYTMTVMVDYESLLNKLTECMNELSLLKCNDNNNDNNNDNDNINLKDDNNKKMI